MQRDAAVGSDRAGASLLEDRVEYDLPLGALGNRLGGGSHSFRVAEEVPALGSETGVQAVDQRHPCRNVESDDFVFAHVVQHFDEGPQAVAMGGDHDTFARPDDRSNRIMPVGHKTLDSVFQAFTSRNIGLSQSLVLWIKAGMTRIILFQGLSERKPTTVGTGFSQSFR